MQQPFYSTDTFPFIRAIEENWEEIHKEYLQIVPLLIDYVEDNLFEAGWKVFGLWNLPHREVLSGTIEKCPFTASIIEMHVPDHGVVGFSVLLPRTRIKPHVGKQGQFLRCHIGLEIPKGDCAIRVSGETRSWQAGKALILDDRLLHDAWNLTSEPRAILLFDFDPSKH
jgi:aspartyl/asparaginyl beta-hydroxylase (cupin superfamily)